eukprot:3959770-Pyramimonas_sp.AAC.1
MSTEFCAGNAYEACRGTPAQRDSSPPSRAVYVRFLLTVSMKSVTLPNADKACRGTPARRDSSPPSRAVCGVGRHRGAPRRRCQFEGPRPGDKNSNNNSNSELL